MTLYCGCFGACSVRRGYKVHPALGADVVASNNTPPSDRQAWIKWAAEQKWLHYRYASFDGMGNHQTTLHHPDSTAFKDLLKSKEISEKYKESKTLLGEGGFSKVKLARTRSTSKEVAMKITSMKDITAQQEVELLTFLGPHHEGICNLVDFYANGKQLHMIFEFCTGGDIMDLVHDEDRLSEKDGARVARCVVSALEYCHSKNIAHRDIKGENVLCYRKKMEEPLRCKLADWGCATYFKNYNQIFSEKIGSSCYMAPEVVKESYLPAKADIWSLGATVWTVLHGEPPFRGPTHDITFERVLTEVIELPKSISVGCSTTAQHFILSCMQRRAWKRPLAGDLIKHPWLSMIDSDKPYPEMEVPKGDDPAQIPHDEVLTMPRS